MLWDDMMYYNAHIFDTREFDKHLVSLEWPVKWEWKGHSIMTGL